MNPVFLKESGSATNVAQDRVLDTTPYVSWICLLMVILSLDVRVYFLDTLPNNKHFQIVIRSGMVDEEPESGCSTSKYLFIYLFIYFLWHPKAMIATPVLFCSHK